MIIAFVAFVGAFTLFVQVRDASLLVSVLVVFVALLLAVGLHETACRELRNYTVTERQVMVGAITGTGLLLLVIWFFGHWDGAGIVGLALAYLGVGVAVEHLLRQEKINIGWFVSVFTAQVVATVVCLLLVIFGLEFMMLAAAIIFRVDPDRIGALLRSHPAEAAEDPIQRSSGHR